MGRSLAPLKGGQVSIDLTFLETSHAHNFIWTPPRYLNSPKYVKTPYWSTVSWDFLGVLILGRAMCAMIRFHGTSMMYLGYSYPNIYCGIIQEDMIGYVLISSDIRVHGISVTWHIHPLHCGNLHIPTITVFRDATRHSFSWKSAGRLEPSRGHFVEVATSFVQKHTCLN